MIKKIYVFLIILILFSMLTTVFAQESVLDEKTQNEISAFRNNTGAETRLLQLEKSIVRNILIGSKAIETIKTNYPETNIENAEKTLDELEALLTKVKEYSFEDKKINERAIDFVAMKKQAIILTQEFRRETQNILTDEEKNQIRKNIDDIENELKELGQKIREKVRAYNAGTIHSLLRNIGTERTDLIRQTMMGEIQQKQISEEIMKEYSSLNSEEKTSFLEKTRELANQREKLGKAIINQVKNNINQKLQELEDSRRQRLDDWIQNVKNQSSNRLERIRNVPQIK